MNRLGAFIGLVLAVLFIGAVGLGVWGALELQRPGPLEAPGMVEIQRGEGGVAIARDLVDNHVIAYPLLFRIAARASGKQAELKAGEYDFPAHVTMADVMDKMARGDVFSRKFTIPEGMTSWQAVQIINAAPELRGEITTIPPEGSLLPQTYTYMKGDVKEAEIQQMQDAMNATLADLWRSRDADSPLQTPAEAVTLASIVEKETGVPAERARIAGLFLNRLKLKMPLQSDPTVIYALTNGQIQNAGQGPLGRHLLSKDLEIDSPYNTYKYPGLPPGPIANPGKDALMAVLHPEHNDYLYFVANGSGGHVFAKTLDEHNLNVAKWRDIRKETNP